MDDDDDEEEPANLDELKNYMVCKDTISILLNYKKGRWTTCQKAVLSNSMPVHGNKGKLTGKAHRFATEVKDDLHEFFEELKEFGSPKATRFVREEAGIGLRDSEIDLVELPTAWSKRAMYARFCFERGHVVTTTATGITKTTERSDAQWDNGNKKTICHWKTFLSYWENNFPQLRIAAPSADICSECHVFFNRSKYAVAASKPLDRTKDSSRHEESTEYYNREQTTTVVAMDLEDVVLESLPEDLQLETHQVELTERESILRKATLHVQQATVQRKLANTRIQQAIDTKDLPHHERHYCFIADFSQNMDLPFFGESQPGDTYYFSPLKINVFGIVDCSIFGGKLSAHVYSEGVGKKGGNNVASMLVNELKRLNIMKENEQGKELTIIMDNCAGQNKNRMVLRLATYLVEAEYFDKVSFVFYIVGHTKNACDRWFNMLKKTYRKRNIYSFEQLTKSMNTHDNIHVNLTTESDFKDWDKFFDSLYKRPAPGTTHKTHIFSATKENKTTLSFRHDDLPETQATHQDLLKKGTNTPDRPTLLKSPPLDTLVPPGIPPIKQVELFSKFRGLIPEAFRDVTCPDPGDEIKGKIKSERNTKQRERNKKIKMEATHNKADPGDEKSTNKNDDYQGRTTTTTITTTAEGR